MTGENLYKEVSKIAENNKDNWSIREGIYSARYITNKFCTDACYRNQAGCIIYALHENLAPEEWNSLDPEITGFLNKIENYERALLGILHYRLNNVVGYLVKGRTGYNWSEDAKKYLELYKKYYGDY